MLGKPRLEQDQIGERLRVARPKLPGRLREAPGDRGPRGMITTGREIGTEPGLRPAPPLFFVDFEFEG